MNSWMKFFRFSTVLDTDRMYESQPPLHSPFPHTTPIFIVCLFIVLYIHLLLPPNHFTVSLSITVEDDNDNSPSFSERTKNISLSETTPTQTSLSLGSAVDPDVGVFTTQRYEILDGEELLLL